MTMNAIKAAPRGGSLSRLTPETAKAIAAQMPASIRPQLMDRVQDALRWHQAEGEADRARFCFILLDALRALDAATARAGTAP